MDKSLLTHQDIHDVTKELRKESLSVKNRLQSILYDVAFVASVKAALGNMPIVPNERCGLWYVHPTNRKTTCYFKSTDGHTNNWGFSMRRLNLHLLDVVGAVGAIAIVDSTRKGKLMPDSLLKTIPIWCAVVNSVLYEGMDEVQVAAAMPSACDVDEMLRLRADNWVRTPRRQVSRNEHHAIVRLIPGFVAEVKRLGLFTRESLVGRLQECRPLVPQWITPEDDPSCYDVGPYSVYCVTASTRTAPAVAWSYVQGAADDHELWARDVCSGNLDARFFWDHVVPELGPQVGLAWVLEAELVLQLNLLYSQHHHQNGPAITVHQLTPSGLSWGAIPGPVDYETVLASVPAVENVVVFSPHHAITNIPAQQAQAQARVLHYPVESSKKGSKELRQLLPTILADLKFSAGAPTVVLCDTGTDIGVGLVLVLLCRFYNLDWTPTSTPTLNKDVVLQHLSKMLEIHRVNPSRATLKSVNTCLFSS